MKKFCMYFLFLILAFGLVSCGEPPSISYAYNTIEFYENETYTINQNDIKVSKNQNYAIEVIDNSIVKIENNVISPLKIGSTTIRFYLVKNTDIYFDVNVTVKSAGLAKSASVENSVVDINIGTTDPLTKLNRVILNSDCTEVPVVTYDSEIIDYNYKTGVVTAKKEGQTTVTITFTKVQTSFRVNVTYVVFVAKLEMNDTVVFADSDGKFDFEIFPSGANRYNFFANSPLIDVFADGRYTTHGTGEVIVGYRYFTEENVYQIKDFKVSIINKVEDMSVSIQNLEENNFALTFKPYDLYVQMDYIEDYEFELSENISIIEDWTYVDDHYMARICFNDSEDNYFSLKYNKTLNGVSNIIDKQININILTLNEVSIACKDGGYQLIRNSDDKFELYFDTDNRAHDIYFTLQYEEQFINADLEINLLNNENRVPVDMVFVPESTGEYVFEISFAGRLLEIVSVVVFN